VSVHSRRVQQKRKEIQKSILIFNRENLDFETALAGSRFGSTAAGFAGVGGLGKGHER